MRHAVSSVFVWIFAIIAGAAIIGLLFLVADTQLDAARTELSNNALRQVYTIFTTQLNSYDTTTRIPIQQNEIFVRCQAEKQASQEVVVLLSQLEIGGLSLPLQTEVVASSESLQTNELLLFSKEWKAPYRVANVLHATTPNQLLVIQPLEDIPQSIQRFNESIPEEIPRVILPTRSSLNSAALAEHGYSPYMRVVFVSRQPLTVARRQQLVSSTNNLPGTISRMHLAFSSQADIREQGVLSYVVDGAHQSYPYYQEAMLTGLIYQSTPQRANCLQHKLTQALTRQTQLQIIRLQELATNHPSATCAGRYGTAPLESLQESITLSDTYQEPYDLVLYDFSNLADAAASVAQRNEQISRGGRCATIY